MSMQVPLFMQVLFPQSVMLMMSSTTVANSTVMLSSPVTFMLKKPDCVATPPMIKESPDSDVERVNDCGNADKDW